MENRRFHSNRPFRSNRPVRGGQGQGQGQGGPPRGRAGGGRGKRQLPPPPMLLGEPSPSLAKINTMNMAKLTEKIAQIVEEQTRVGAKLERLKAVDPLPEEKIKSVTELLVRLAALKEAAEKRLAGKAERKAARNQ